MRPARPCHSQRDASGRRRTCAEYFRVLLFGEHEDLVERAFAHDGVPVPGERQAALVAEFPERMEALADALLLAGKPPAGDDRLLTSRMRSRQDLVRLPDASRWLV
ncbi:hypothetical protein GGQ85_000218 [Nitrobacter vulgaris]|nr:hypothetical protein [Nitrobacter vulgaris]